MGLGIRRPWGFHRDNSAIIAAMGVAPEIAASAIRVSLGWKSTAEDIDRFIAAWSRLPAKKLAA